MLINSQCNTAPQLYALSFIPKAYLGGTVYTAANKNCICLVENMHYQQTSRNEDEEKKNRKNMLATEQLARPAVHELDDRSNVKQVIFQVQ